MKYIYYPALIGICLIIISWVFSILSIDFSNQTNELCDWGINENEVLIKVCQVKKPELNLEVRLMHYTTNRIGQTKVGYKVLKNYSNISMVDTMYFISKNKLYLKVSLSGTKSKTDTLTVRLP
jgi:hypothetical protein